MPSGSEHHESEALEVTAERCEQGSQEEVYGEEGPRGGGKGSG